MDIRYLLINAIFSFVLATQATTVDVNLSGRVLDASGAGVTGVEVAIKGTDFKATTDISGNWSLVSVVTTTFSNSRLLMPKGTGHSAVYNIMGRKMEGSVLDYGAYVTSGESSFSSMQTHHLAKALGDPDTLVVSYAGVVVGYIEQANLVVGALSNMTLRNVSPLLIPSDAGTASSSFYILVGQTAQVSFSYDAQMWRPTWLLVGQQKTTATGHDFFIFLANATDSISLELATREQDISFNALSDKTYGDASFTLSATASSKLEVSFASKTQSVCTVNGQSQYCNDGNGFDGLCACEKFPPAMFYRYGHRDDLG